jgi:alpha-galactosidase
MDANAPTPYRTRLAPGETFEAPAVFLGCYRGDVDDGANRLRRWVDTNLRPTTRETRWPYLIGSPGHDATLDERQARKQITEASALGLEAYLLDARWFREVGDWRPDPERFPDGLAALADDARAQGLKFGLEADWTQGGNRNSAAGSDLVLSVFDSGQQFWFPRRYPPDWKPGAFTGATVCLGEPKAEAWGLNALRRLLHDHKLDLLAQDGPLLVEQCAQDSHRHTDAPTDVAYQAARGLYRIQDALRAPNPGLQLVNGGSLLDYGLVRRTNALRLTEARTPLAARRALYDASYAFPPALCACSVAIPPDSDLPRFLCALRSGLMGLCILPGDFTKWSAEQRTAAKRQFAVYKTWLRPLLTNGDLYHLTERPDGVRWDGMQVADPKTGRSVLFAFRGTTPETGHTFRPRGLDPATTYQVSFEEGTDPPFARTGDDLMKNGIAVRLAERETSALVYLQASP